MAIEIEFEWRDGSLVKYSAVDNVDAWDLVRLADPTGDEILSAWREGKPWFGACADMHDGRIWHELQDA